MSNVNMPSEQSRSSTTTTASSRDNMRSVISNNSMNTDGSIAAITVEATTTTVVGKNKRAAEVQDATASCTDSKTSGYTQQQHCRHRHHHHRHQPSAKLSLRDISDILKPFFGTSTALPSSQPQEQQQRGQQHDDHHHHENAASAASNDHNDLVLFSGVENPRQGLGSSSDGDESIGAAAEGSQAIQELIGAPEDSWIQSIWEMEFEKNKTP